jgi:hypothetical protein
MKFNIRQILTTAAVLAAASVGSLAAASPALAGWVPGACSAGAAGVICGGGGYVNPAPSDQILVTGRPTFDGFDNASDNWKVTFWFRAGPDQPGTPDHGLTTTVHDLEQTPLFFTGLIPTGHYYWAWATLDKNDGNGATPLYITTDLQSSGTWRSAELLAVDDPNQVGAPTEPSCLDVSQYTQNSDGTPLVPKC